MKQPSSVSGSAWPKATGSTSGKTEGSDGSWMDDDAYDLGMPEDDSATYSALGGGALPGGLGAAQAAYNQQAEGIRAMYAQAERMLRDREAQREKGSQSERLLAIAAALGQPTRTGSLGETLGNVNTALLGGMKSQRERKEALEDMLFQQRMASNNLLAKLHSQYFTAATRQSKPRTGFNPLTGKLVDMDTGLPVTPPPPAVGEVREGYKFMGGDPSNPSNWQKV